MAKRKGQVKGATALRFYHEVLHLDELHAGVWAGEPLTMDGLRSAQRRYNECLIEQIPENVRTILDVGAGTGVVSELLRDRGFEVEGLSPDPYQQGLYTKRTGRPFHLDWFEHFEPPRQYDLVLMSESAQYIPLERLFEKAAEVAPGGYLLAADFFVIRDEDNELARRGHRLDAFEREAARCGFTERYREDITDATLPTMDLAREFVERHVDPALKLVAEIYGPRRPLLFALAKRMLRRRAVEWEKSMQLIDSEAFARLKRYLILLYEHSGIRA
jgi:SAM-dependent methyltransferase